MPTENRTDSSITNSVERIVGVVSCPKCDGLPVVNPFQNYAEVDCEMCGGTGKIDPEQVCYCGRPGRFKLENEAVCGLLDCMKAVFNGVF